LAAIKLLESGADVVLACKTGLAESNSRYAQGGIAAAAPSVASAFAKNADASAKVIPGGKAPIQAHLADTIKAGAGLVDEKVAEEIVGNGWRLIELLSGYGVVFDHLPDGSYSLAREGGHSAARVYHHQDVTGTWICNALIDQLMSFAKQKKAGANNNLHILDHTFACDLIMADGICVGARMIKDKTPQQKELPKQEEIMTVLARHTILGTGGIGQVFSRTTNPAIATGDGIAMAYHAGAELIDMEFVQFHPTALRLPNVSDAPTMLISEAVRGAGALLLDHNKERFMRRFDPAGELATRDVIARSMYEVMKETGSEEIFLDFRPIGKEVLEENFPNILRQLSQYGINALEELVPVSPAAHYFMGGIKASYNGKTSIPFLYAVGECASTGLHGANRLASNSLLEAGAMALNVAGLIGADIRPAGNSGFDKNLNCSEAFSPLTIPCHLPTLRRLMFAQAGIVRSASSLGEAIISLNNDSTQANYSVAAAEAANILLTAKLIAQSALRREESRGAHYRSDYPQTDEKFAARQIVYNQGQADRHKWTGVRDLCPNSN